MSDILMLSLFIVAILFVLMFPTILASLRGCRHFGSIFLVNLLGMWIGGIGWVIALVWAITDDVNL